MFESKRKLREKIAQYECRVAVLEERLCPGESHKWKKVNWHLVGGTGMGDETTVYTYKCERCGKQVLSYD